LDLDGLVREGARRMLVTALKAEVDTYVAAHAEERDSEGHALVVRNGVARPRQVTTAAGELEIEAPRGERPAGGQPVHEQDPAAVGEAITEGERGAAGALPAGDLDQGLRARAGRVLRQRDGAERVDGAAADRGVDGGSWRSSTGAT
jgi:Transposase, Mutator family